MFLSADVPYHIRLPSTAQWSLIILLQCVGRDSPHRNSALPPAGEGGGFSKDDAGMKHGELLFFVLRVNNDGVFHIIAFI